MRFFKLISLLFITSFGILFTSCEETAEVDEYANWEERNTEYINAIAKEAENNDKWQKILSFKLNEKDIYGEDYPHGRRMQHRFLRGEHQSRHCRASKLHPHQEPWSQEG